MRRKQRKFIKKNKYALFFSALLLIILAVTIVKVWPETKKAVKVINKSYVFEQYYAPISHYTDPTNSLSFDDLKAKLSSNASEEIFLGKSEKDNIKKLFGLEAYQAKVVFLNDQELIDKIAEKGNRLAIAPYQLIDSRVKTLQVDGKLLWSKEASTYPLKLKMTTDDKLRVANQFDPKKVSLMTNIGDVILGRYVAHQMRKYGDYTHPWLKMADFINQGDLTFADLEVPLSDQIAPSDEGMSFITPQKSIEGLKLAGIDVVSLANNHSTNYGEEVFGETLALLKKEGISYVGGGVNSAEAYKPLIIEKNGLKWGFVNFNSIIGAIEASADSAGVAEFSIKPWAESDDPKDLERIKTAIIETKKQADIVVAAFHWGVEYQADPIESQIKVAHAAVEAGADLVVGTHPHVVQGIENYQKTPIFYSLGNFIFDQEWSIETKQGIVAETYFYKKKLVDVRLTPYQIEDYNQPRLTNPEESKTILDRIYGASLSNDYK